MYSVLPRSKAPARIHPKNVYFHGSRQIDNVSRRYYEQELGAGIAPPMSGTEHFGYTEPLRRFIQRESFEPQANEIPNTAPSWLPGDDYYTNFKVGDPFIKVDQGYARLPGAGYEALHPELKGLDPEDYPGINKLAILADVAPYSREYQVLSSCLAQKTSRARARQPPPSRTIFIFIAPSGRCLADLRYRNMAGMPMRPACQLSRSSLVPRLVYRYQAWYHSSALQGDVVDWLSGVISCSPSPRRRLFPSLMHRSRLAILAVADL